MNSLGSEYQIRRLDKDKLADVARLHEAVYGRKLPVHFWEAKYNTTYTGHEFTGFIAFDNQNNPAAFYAVIPCFIKSGEEIVLSAQSADTMTHLEHRNKGLFIALANRTFELCIKEEIRLIFGFPNQHSERGLIKMGWQKIGYMQRFTFPVKTIPLEKIASKTTFLKKLYLAYVNLIIAIKIQPANGFSGAPYSDQYAGICRNNDYLNYKSYHQTFTIKVEHELVWFKIQNGLIIGDISRIDGGIFEILKQVKTLAKKLGLNQVSFQVPGDSPAYHLLKTKTDAVISFPVMIKDLNSGVDITSLRFAFADIDIF